MTFIFNKKDLLWLACGFALELGLWLYFLLGAMTKGMVIDMIAVLIFLAGLHYLFKVAIRRHDRAHLIILAFILGLLGVLASELVAGFPKRDLLGYLALFGANFVPAALCAYGVRRPAPAATASSQP